MSAPRLTFTRDPDAANPTYAVHLDGDLVGFVEKRRVKFNPSFGRRVEATRWLTGRADLMYPQHAPRFCAEAAFYLLAGRNGMSNAEATALSGWGDR